MSRSRNYNVVTDVVHAERRGETVPLFTDWVGVAGGAAEEVIDDRWSMNYAASVRDSNSAYFETRHEKRLPTHPAYVSHQEWEAIGLLHQALDGMTPLERIRGVHSYQDTEIIRPLSSGDAITSVARVVGVDERRSGGRLSVRVDTRDAAGELRVTSLTTTVFRDVAVVGEDVITETTPGTDGPQNPAAWNRTESLFIDAVFAHVFSECARDYNPIHTDIRVAVEAGLPGLILHGTGSLAVAVSSLTNHEAMGDPAAVRRFGGRLGAMVLCPSAATLRVSTVPEACRARYELLTQEGQPGIGGGFFEWAPARETNP